MHHNFILHRHRVGGPWRVLAWDADLLLREVDAPANYGAKSSPEPPELSNLLMARMLSMPSILRQYLEHLTDLLDGPLATGITSAALAEISSLSSPDALLDVYKRQREEDAPYLEGVETLKQVVEAREGYLRASIDELMPPKWVDLSINEMVFRRDPEYRAKLELHYRGQTPFSIGELYATDDRGDLLKWPLPMRTMERGGFEVLLIPDQMADLSWVAITASVEGGGTIVDSMNVVQELLEPAMGRVPDGYGLIRPLPVATAGGENFWMDPVTLTAKARTSVVAPQDRFQVDLELEAHWRADLVIELHLEVLKSGGLGFQESPLKKIVLPRLEPGDVWEGVDKLLVPWGTEPGRYDLVYAVVEPATELRLTEDVATVFVDSGKRHSLVINELCASNKRVISDEFGDFDDWAEVYNPLDTAITLGGYYLTDDPAREPRKWAFSPSETIEPGEKLLVWADEDVAQGPHHLSFKFGRDGEEMAIVKAVGDTNLVVDRIVFGYQDDDWSFGRYPDGGVTWERFAQPTPGDPNIEPTFH